MRPLRESFPTFWNLVAGTARLVARHRCLIVLLAIGGITARGAWWWYVEKDELGFPHRFGPPLVYRAEDAQSADNISRFGALSGPTIDRTDLILFCGGQYVDSPYRINTRGLAVSVNEAVFDRVTWPDSLYTPDEPPLPTGLSEQSTFDDLARGLRLENVWIIRMRCYLQSHHPPKEARPQLLAAYRRLPFVRSIQLTSVPIESTWDKPERLVIDTTSGETLRIPFSCHSTRPLPRDAVVAELQRRMELLEQNLGRASFVLRSQEFPSWSIELSPEDRSWSWLPEIIGVLESDSSPPIKRAKLRILFDGRCDDAAWDQILDQVIRSYMSSPQLHLRIASIREQRAIGGFQQAPALVDDMTPEIDPIATELAAQVLTPDNAARTQLNTALEEIVRLFEDDHLDAYIDRYVHPVSRSRLGSDTLQRQHAIDWLRSDRDKNLEILRRCRQQTPWISDAGDRAEYTVFVNEFGYQSRRFRKVGRFWYDTALGGSEH